MKSTNPNQSVFEIARDIISTVQNMKIDETVSFKVTKKGVLHDFSCDRHMHCGLSIVSNALKVAYRAAIEEFYHEK